MTDEPLDATDYVVQDPPGWLPDPVQRWLADLTYREWHAIWLGVVGFPLGLAYAAGRQEALPIAVALVAITFGLRKAPDDAPVASRIIHKEPWYFLVPLTTLFSAGVAVYPFV